MPSRKALKSVLTALSALLAVFGGGIAVASVIWDGMLYNKDFIQEYVMARAIRDHIDPYQLVSVLGNRYLGVTAGQPHPTPHPPLLGIVMIPFSFLSYQQAALLWMILSVVAFVVAVHRLLADKDLGLPKWVVLGLLGAGLGSNPATSDFIMGQTMSLLLLLFVIANSLLSRSRPIPAGIALGLSLMIKPVAWPLLPILVIYKKWTALKACLLTVIIGYLISAWVVGTDTVVTYVTVVLPNVSALYKTCVANIAIWTVGWRTFLETGGTWSPVIKAPPLVHSEQAAIIASVALSGGLAVAILVMCARVKDWSAAFAIGICFGALVGPVSWWHYLILALPAFVWVLKWLKDRNFPSRETRWLSVLALLVYMPWLGWSFLYILMRWNPVGPGNEYRVGFLPALLPLSQTFAALLTAVTVAVLAMRSKHEGQMEDTRFPLPVMDPYGPQ